MDNDGDISGLLKESAHSFLKNRFNLQSLRGRLGMPSPVDRALWNEMAELGWLATGLDESLGGLGRTLAPATVLADAFGRAAYTEPFIAASVIPSRLLSACDRSDGVVELAGVLASGQAIVTVAWSEGPSQFDAVPGQTTIQGGHAYGVKRFVPAVEPDGMLIVAAKREDETVLAAVAVETEGVSVSMAPTAGGTLAEIRLNGAAIRHVLATGEAADNALAEAIEAGRIALAAQAAGIAAGCLERTLHYVSDRVQFGRPIGSFQSVQHRCVDIHIANSIAGASWHEALKRFEQDHAAERTRAAISSAKARCVDAALAAGKLGIQLHGAMGFTEEADIGYYLRAATGLAGWLGSSMEHRRRFIALWQGMELDHG